MQQDLAEKFWKEYVEADISIRDKKLDNITKGFDELRIIKDDKMRNRAIKTLLRSYFDDLIDYMRKK